MGYEIRHNNVLNCEEVVDLDLHFVVELCKDTKEACQLINGLEGRY